jgi:hypothetical protein
MSRFCHSEKAGKHDLVTIWADRNVRFILFVWLLEKSDEAVIISVKIAIGL